MSAYRFVRLEERILLDGSVAAVVDPTGGTVASDGHLLERVLVVPADTPQAAALAANAKDNVHVVIYDSTTTTLQGLQQQITAALGGNKASSIGFINRGSSSQFALSQSTLISEQTLMSDQQMQQFWSNIGQDLDAQGQIDILVSGNLSTNLLYGLQTITQAHVVETSNLSGSDLLDGGAGMNYFNTTLLGFQDQLVGLMHSSALSFNDSTTAITPLPSDLIHFNLAFNASTLAELMPTFASSGAWNYSVTPGADGSINVLLTLNNDVNLDIDALMNSSASNLITGAVTDLTGGTDGGPILHLNLSITKSAFNVIEKTLEDQSGITFNIDANGFATVVLKNPADFGSLSPAQIFAKEYSLLASSLTLNNIPLQITLFNTATDLTHGSGTTFQNGVTSFFTSDKFIDYLGQYYTSFASTPLNSAASLHDVANRGFDFADLSRPIDSNHSAVKMNEQHPSLDTSNNRALEHNSDRTATAMLALGLSTGGVHSSSEATAILNQFDHTKLDSSDSMFISEHLLPNQKFGEMPFYPEHLKLINASAGAADMPLKSVLGALTWADIKLDGKQGYVPKESSLIQDFPNKTINQGNDAGVFSNRAVIALQRFGKGYLGLKD